MCAVLWAGGPRARALRLCEDQEEYCPAGYSSMAMLVRATAERFLPSRGLFWADADGDDHD